MSAPLPKPISIFLWEDTLPTQYALDILRTSNANTPISELLDRSARLVGEVDKLLLSYREMVTAYEHQGGELRKAANELSKAEAELEKVSQYLAALDEEGPDEHDLAHLVRYYHDRNHATQFAWAVCAHEICRRAGRYVA